jgi:CheY-like chemotaxis protein
MSKRVLDVGQCPPDHAAIRRFVESACGVEVVQTHHLDDTLDQLRSREFSLVLVNRKLDIDYSDGLDILRAIKSDPQLAAVPVMLVSNYPEAQQAAIEAGAVPGFGKAQLSDSATIDCLALHLG